MTSAPGGIMPTISWGRPSIPSFCPTSGRCPNAVRHNSWERIAIGGGSVPVQRAVSSSLKKRPCAGRISANRRERPVHLAELDVLWRRERTSGAPNGRSFCRQIHQLIGFWIVEGPQQHSMHDRENGNICSDPKRQRGDDNSCEPWTLR